MKKPLDPRVQDLPNNYSIGCHTQPKRDLTRYVRWPKYVRLQRQRSILKRRLKVPPAINQFRRALDRNGAAQVLRLLNTIRPETKIDKRTRLYAEAESQINGEKKMSPKPINVKYGINHVTALIESQKAKLVIIAHDVDPIELVVFLPALCRKMRVPYCIIKGKSRLGAVVHKRTATALAVVDVHPSNQQDLIALVRNVNAQFADKADDIRKTWGGGIMGLKSIAKSRKLAETIAKERMFEKTE